MSRKCRMYAAAFGGAFMLAGGGTIGTAMAAKFLATLNGDNILAAAGDKDGWGRVKIDVNDDTDRLCADVEVRSVGKVRSVQIYRGAAGQAGTPVVKLDTPDDNDSDDCDAIGDALADEIQANPAAFYVMVATEDHPEGAIRGQLAPNAD